MSTSHEIGEPRYQVVWPLGRTVEHTREPQSRVARLEEATIGLVWDYGFRGDEMFEILKPELETRYPGVKFVDYAVFGNIHGADQRNVVEQLPDRLAEHGVDAVIVAVGA